MKICPWCKEEITKIQKENDEIYINGGGYQTGNMTELWHSSCAEEAEEYERENGLRQ